MFVEHGEMQVVDDKHMRGASASQKLAKTLMDISYSDISCDQITQESLPDGISISWVRYIGSIMVRIIDILTPRYYLLCLPAHLEHLSQPLP